MSLNIGAILPQIDRIKKHLDFIARPRDAFENYEVILEMESYLEKQFVSYGYAVEKHPFQVEGYDFNNLIARHTEGGQARHYAVGGEGRKSSDSTGPCFIIGAHFDAVPGSYGADDNASGVAALLEAARILAGADLKIPVDFIAFNVEEYGMIGSTYYVRRLKEQKAEILGMISLEMVGYTNPKKGSQQIPFFLKPFYPDVGNFLALVGDSKSKKFLEKAKKAFSEAKGLPVETLWLPARGWLMPEVRLSDHSPFWDEGYPALLVTDTSFFRNPYYHSPQDRIETLDLEFLSRVTEGVVRLAQSLP